MCPRAEGDPGKGPGDTAPPEQRPRFTIGSCRFSFSFTSITSAQGNGAESTSSC